MSAEEVTAVENTVADSVADNSTAQPASSSSKKKDNSYYYWHGHEKERAKVGDVAPKTSPLLVKSEALAPEHRSPLLAARSITKYSWCNNTKSVSVYVDFDGVQDLAQDNIKIEFDVKKLSIQIKGADGANNVLHLRLAKEIAPEKSSFRLKPNQIVVKLDKGDSDATWYDLVDNKAVTDDE